ncbi:IS110 family transposase [Rhizobium mongolense]|uniref:IS110 family transposase n=1 Tax=Rhizobium mongolense TaxID=57676 RepID=UPI0034A10CD9
MTIFVGVDWGGSSHAVCIVDPAGGGLGDFAVAHERDGLADLVAPLRWCGPPGETPTAIERPSGLVDTLLHPTVVKARRPRYRGGVAASSDPRDA